MDKKAIEENLGTTVDKTSPINRHYATTRKCLALRCRRPS